MVYKNFVGQWGDYIDANGNNTNVVEANMAYTPQGINYGWTTNTDMNKMLADWGLFGGNFPNYDVGIAYKVGDIFRYSDGKLYKVISAHTSQLDWPPDQLLALYNVIRPAAPEGAAISMYSYPTCT